MMIFNLCLLMNVYLVLSASGKEYDDRSVSDFLLIDVRQICENLRNFYELINPLVDLKLELDFGKNSPHLYLYGKGTVVFSPFMTINHCEVNTKNRTTVINVVINDILIIQFDNRPWVVIEDSDVQIYLSRTSTQKPGEIIIKILSISVAKFRRASANCEQDLIRPEEVKFILNGALAVSWLVGSTYKLRGENRPESTLTRLFEEVFQYYISKLTTDAAVGLNFETGLKTKVKKTGITCGDYIASFSTHS